MSKEINFDSLNIKISNIVKSYSIEEQKLIFEYLSQLDEINVKAYHIAYNHLGTSFSISRSNGFKIWLSDKTK
jgi:hypothetical protein